MSKLNPALRRTLQCALLSALVFAFLGAGDPASRFSDIGHQLMCICGCHQILLECNHVGCPDSDGMRNELMAAVNRGDSDSLVRQAFVQKYGPTVLAAPGTTGFDRAAWIFPGIAFVVGVTLIVLVVRAWKKRLPPKPPGSGGSPVDPELKKFREQALAETDL